MTKSNKTNRQKFSEKLLQSFPKKIAKKMAKFLKSKGYNPELLDGMTAEQFDEFLKEVVPVIKEKAIDAASKNKNTKWEKMLMDGADKFGTSWPFTWTRDEFLKALGREGKKDGKTQTEKDAHIGRLSTEDIMRLRQKGLTEDEIEMLAERFRNEYQSERAKQSHEQMTRDIAKAEVEDNKKAAKEYEDSAFGKLSSFFAPEVTRTIREKIARGEDPYEDIPALAKATGIDAAVWAASLYGGNLALRGAGKLASKIPAFGKFADKIPNALKTFFAPLGAVAFDSAIDGAAEYGRQQVSDYQDGTDWSNIGNVAGTSATLPGIVTGAVSGLNMIPQMGRIVRPIMKQIKGNAIDLATREEVKISDMFDEIKTLSERVKKGDALANEVLNEKLAEASAFLKNHPEAPTNRPLTYDYIKEIASDKNLRKTFETPPDQEYFETLAQMKQGTDEIDEALAKGDNLLAKELEAESKLNEITGAVEDGWYPDLAGRSSDWATETLEKAKKTWPGHWEDLQDNPAMVKLGKAINNVVPVVAKSEVARARNSSEKKKQFRGEPKQFDQTMVKLWKSNMLTHDGDGNLLPEYVDWLLTNTESE